MIYGPFQREDAGKIILNFSKDKLLPSITDLEKFVIKVADYEITFISSFSRKKLNQLNSEYKEKNKNFYILYHLFSTPDELFKEIKKTKGIKDKPQLTEIDGGIIADYFTAKQMIMNSFGEGFKLLGTTERQLDRYYQSADQKVATILSIFAITISIIVAIWRL